MNKELIDLSVERAINAINNDFDFDCARNHIYKAFNEIGSNKKLAYYDVINRVLSQLHYNVRGFSKKSRVKECYSSLLKFIQVEFENIEYVDINPDSEMDMGLSNSICCDVVSNVGAFAKGMRQFYIDFGVLTALGNNKKYLDTYMPIVMKCERAAMRLLKRFANPTPQVRQNIALWEEEVNGKYGAKYL